MLTVHSGSSKSPPFLIQACLSIAKCPQTHLAPCPQHTCSTWGLIKEDYFWKWAEIYQAGVLISWKGNWLTWRSILYNSQIRHFNNKAQFVSHTILGKAAQVCEVGRGERVSVWVNGLWEWCRSPFLSLSRVQQMSRCKVIFNWVLPQGPTLNWSCLLWPAFCTFRATHGPHEDAFQFINCVIYKDGKHYKKKC